ncbi:hypothetical protein E6Q11_03295 [Candidatus Dojkabacteria bacterium]|uniref:ATP-grasp domain-containing protein n=1 Tax=Candidatus Dojkabacteria bacterium TaxID=2099670 RepID=A0A5C7J9D6_9BACT|nr:MAG: hypothetical protein E6Q11_03295 [Candidatus Dojkabacteria bacterium]
MKNVVIVFGGNMQPSDPPFSRHHYQQAYELLYPMAEAAGLTLYRAPLLWFDFEKNVFTQAWAFNQNKGWHLVSDVRPDLIEDRTNFSEENQAKKNRLAKLFPLFNDPEFTKVANSKYETSLLFPQYFKPYHRINSKDALLQTLETIKGDSVVIKPEFGSGGKGVIIDTPTNIQRLALDYPLMLQEFIDSSHGIPGITPGYHDLRLVFINEELIYSYIRIPKEGSLLANVAQGGTMEIIEPHQLPATLDPIIHDVQKVFTRFPRKTYTIDVLFDETAQPWIVELNTMPGVYFAPGQEVTRDHFYRALINDFQAILTEIRPS